VVELRCRRSLAKQFLFFSWPLILACVPLLPRTNSPPQIGCEQLRACFNSNSRKVGKATLFKILTRAICGTATLGCPLRPGWHRRDSQEWLSYRAPDCMSEGCARCHACRCGACARAASRTTRPAGWFARGVEPVGRRVVAHRVLR
jgi:hypothetical protein